MKLSSPANNMNKSIRLLLVGIITVILFLSTAAFASPMVNGKSTINYKNSFFSSSPNEQVKAVAVKLAKRQAWEKYIQGFSPAKLTLYREVEPKILESLDIYLLKVNIIDEKTDEENNRYSVTVRVTINEARLQTVFADAASKGKQKSGKSELFSYLFVAREQNSVVSYDKTRIKTQIKRGDQSMTSGSTEKTADKVEYRLLGAGTIDASMNQTLTTAGFEVVNYEDVVSECGGTEPKEIRETFTVSDSITREQRKTAIKAAKTCQVSYFAVGTLDVVMADTDPVTGNKRVYVSVKSQVWNIKDRLPKQVSSVGPIQYQGLGPNDLVAQNNALSLATESVAKEIINQLNAKGLH